MNNWKIITWLLLVLGGLFTIYGCYLFVAALKFKKNSLQAKGIVVEVKSRTNKYKIHLYAPVIKFTTHDNREIIFESNSYKKTQIKTGETIPVLYLAENPSIARTDDFQTVWGGSFLFLSLGIVSLVAGSLVRYFQLKTV